MTEINRDPVENRVLSALNRLGLDSITVEDGGNGIIQLDGLVSNMGDKTLAIAAVRSVSGVIKVKSKLKVNSP